MTTSIILDIETLSRRPDALVTEIAAIAFNRSDFVPIDHIELFPGFFPQILTGRHICPETVIFHQEQGTLITRLSDQAPANTLDSLADFIRRHTPQHIWIQGPDFDRPIIEHLAIQNRRTLPWDYWRVRDSRTAWNLAFPGIKQDKRPHRSLLDCRATLNDLARSLITLDRRESA